MALAFDLWGGVFINPYPMTLAINSCTALKHLTSQEKPDCTTFESQVTHGPLLLV